MEIGTIIGSTIALLIMGFWVLVIFRTEDRKCSLTIMKDGNKIKLFLSDDDYCDFDISDIIGDEKQIYNEIKKVIQARSKELVKFVDRVSFFKDGDKAQEEELMKIIQSAATSSTK